MSAPTTSTLAKLLAATCTGRPRCIENLRPGQWWLGEYEDGPAWAEVRVTMSLTNRVTGAKTVRVLGACADGQRAELHQLRGFAVPSLTAVQARKAGLAVVVRIAVDADCPRCGYPERFYEPARQVFGCSSLNPQPCGYESTERDA